MKVQRLLPLCCLGECLNSELCFFLCKVCILVPAWCASQGPCEGGMELCLLSTYLCKAVSLLPLC